MTAYSPSPVSSFRLVCPGPCWSRLIFAIACDNHPHQNCTCATHLRRLLPFDLGHCIRISSSLAGRTWFWSPHLIVSTKSGGRRQFTISYANRSGSKSSGARLNDRFPEQYFGATSHTVRRCRAHFKGRFPPCPDEILQSVLAEKSESVFDLSSARELITIGSLSFDTLWSLMFVHSILWGMPIKPQMQITKIIVHNSSQFIQCQRFLSHKIMEGDSDEL
jgi:hypothetical protein